MYLEIHLLNLMLILNMFELSVDTEEQSDYGIKACSSS